MGKQLDLLGGQPVFENHAPLSQRQLVSVAETDCFVAALPRLGPVQQRNQFCNLPAVYIALHILFNHQTLPIRLWLIWQKSRLIMISLRRYLRKILGGKATYCLYRKCTQKTAPWRLNLPHSVEVTVRPKWSNLVGCLAHERFVPTRQSTRQKAA